MKTFSAAFVNLLKTSIGSGVLSFPYLFKTYGIVPSILLTFISGFFATCGLVLLTICSAGLGRSADLSKLATQAFPSARIVVDLAVFLKCFGVSLSYIIITKSLIPNVLNAMAFNSKFFLYSPVNLLIFLGFVGPFAYFSKLDNLKYTSFLGVFFIFLVIAASIVRFIYSPVTADTSMFQPISLDWTTGLGKFIFSFTCHQNIFAVNAELDDNSFPRMKKLIKYVATTAFFMYISFGLTNYLIYGSDITNNILEKYPNDYLGTFVRILYIFVMGVSFPLQMAPARIYFMNMFHLSKPGKNSYVSRFIVTSFLILCAYLLAVSGVELGIVYSIVGATASCFMCLILPALFYLNLNIQKTIPLILASYLSFIFGIFIFITTMVSLLIPKKETH